ncbi:MAG TPA: ATP-binding protein, partial [Herpetosiphonaceae bacterium]|nr:ATP-binding protein [Herpetosiphonaceae bacterium]
QEATADIRRLVYALRPPALDDLGLIAALREQANQYGHTGLHITVEAPEQLPALPAAVEVAAYRMAQEALTNVVRHAEARICRVRLFRSDTTLCLEICDDGHGLPAGHRAGVGLHSMRERAAELGGSCTIETRPEGGTLVAGYLPLGTTSAGD